MTATNTIDFLYSDAAKAGRLTRVNGYAALGLTNATHVVHFDTLRMGIQELDAESEAHALAQVDGWLANGMALSARYYRVAVDGSLTEDSGLIRK